jgi:hypothetical protein
MMRIETNFSINSPDGETYWSVSVLLEDQRSWIWGYLKGADVMAG